MFENRNLRKTYGSKMVGVTGGGRKLRNEELHDSYASQSVIGVIKSTKMHGLYM
jgi:hypothetical protein